MLQVLKPGSALLSQAQDAVRSTPVWDLHTHLYPPSFGTPSAGDAEGLMLWGIDELLTYHYLVAEVFRAAPAAKLPVERFWKLSKTEQADVIWEHLFRRNTPLSEACRGVLTTLSRLGLDPNEPTLDAYRKWFAEQDPSAQIDKIMELAGVERITMTNDVFDDNERIRWLENPQVGQDSRFRGVLRFDPLVIDWKNAAQKMNAWGYDVASAGLSDESNERTLQEGRRFVREWIERIDAVYCAVSLPPEFRYPAPPADQGVDQAAVDSTWALSEIVLPVCEELGLPFAMMIGVTRGLNPAIRMAGDMVGPADLPSVAALCRDFPNVNFLCTVLSREDQHELAVLGRKFRNLLPFGCWWFVNNPSLIEEITRMRFELLGPSFVPQHSDCRVLEQLLYKWDHSREIIAKVLADKYADLAATGWEVTQETIERDARALLWDNTAAWLGE